MKTDIRRTGSYSGRQDNSALYSLCLKVYERMLEGEDVFDETVFLFRRRGKEALDMFDGLYVELYDKFAGPEAAFEIQELYSYAYDVSQKKRRRVS